MDQVEFNGAWFPKKTEYRVRWTEFTGYKDGVGKEMIFYADYSRGPKDDALAFAEELRTDRAEIGREVGDIKVFERCILPWEEIEIDG